MASPLRETAPVLTGVAGGLVVLGAAVAVLVAAPYFDRLLPPSPGPATPTPSLPASPSPSVAVNPSPSGSVEIGLQAGQLAPPLEVDDLDGKTINLASLRGKAVWLDFTGSWLPASYDELPLMQGYWTRLKSHGVVIVGIALRDDKAQAQALVKQTGVTFTVGIDPNSSTEQYWAGVSLPVHFWIDKGGVIRASAFGGIGADKMEAGLSSIVPEIFPTPGPTGGAIGDQGPSPSAGSSASP